MKRFFLFVLFIIFISVSHACTVSSETFDALGLAQVRSERHLRSLLKPESSNRFLDFFRLGRDDVMEDDGATDDSNNERDHSETNVQVEGVDEADIIKTDGERIYYIRGNVLTVIEIDEEGGMSVVHDAVRGEEERGVYRELYLAGDELIVIGNFFDDSTTDREPSAGIDDVDFMWPRFYTMTTVDIYDKTTLEPRASYKISGSLMETRRIDDVLYLVSSHSPGNADDPRPYFYQGDDLKRPDYSDIKYLPDVPTRVFTVITTIHLGEDDSLSYDIFLGPVSWGQFYVSREGILMASNVEYITTEVTGRTDDGNTVTRNEWVGKLIYYRFSEEGTVEYGGSGEYLGLIINQFAMDEHEGTIRIVTRSGWGQTAINRLYIFEQDTLDGKPILRQMALLDEGIGKPAETVRSVRFADDIVTVVTFEEIDPFYVIDLSDPENPTILGELEVPGFSVYQHPWKNDTIIGVGYETDERGIVIGLKLSLYDIADRHNPVEVGESLVMLNESDGWQYGEALHNHKAILVSERYDFIAFAIGNSRWTTIGNRHQQDYLIFGIDVSSDTPITIIAAISHLDFYDSGYREDYGVNRAVTIDDKLYVLSPSAISAHDITEGFALIDHVRFNMD